MFQCLCLLFAVLHPFLDIGNVAAGGNFSGAFLGLYFLILEVHLVIGVVAGVVVKAEAAGSADVGFVGGQDAVAVITCHGLAAAIEFVQIGAVHSGLHGEEILVVCTLAGVSAGVPIAGVGGDGAVGAVGIAYGIHPVPVDKAGPAVVYNALGSLSFVSGVGNTLCHINIYAVALAETAGEGGVFLTSAAGLHPALVACGGVARESGFGRLGDGGLGVAPLFAHDLGACGKLICLHPLGNALLAPVCIEHHIHGIGPGAALGNFLAALRSGEPTVKVVVILLGYGEGSDGLGAGHDAVGLLNAAAIGVEADEEGNQTLVPVTQTLTQFNEELAKAETEEGAEEATETTETTEGTEETTESAE